MSIGTVYESAYKGDFNQVKVRIDENKSLLTTPDSNDRLLLHWAALGGNENLVEYLIDLGCPVNPLDDTNSTPLILAASAGRFEIVRLLIGKGAEVNQKTNRGQTPLHYACSKGHKEITKFLIEAGADINATDVLGATPLHRAASQGRNYIVQLLLSCEGLNIDACDSSGNTALHAALEQYKDVAACMIIKAGADQNIKNKDNLTPSDVCQRKIEELSIEIEE